MGDVLAKSASHSYILLLLLEGGRCRRVLFTFRGGILKKSVYHEQDWQSYPVDPYSATSDGHIYY